MTANVLHSRSHYDDLSANAERVNLIVTSQK